MIYKLNISVPLMSRRVEFRFVPSKNVTPTSPLVAVVPIEWFGQMYVMWCDGGKWPANQILEFLTANLPCQVDKDPRLTAMLSIASQIPRRKNNNFAIQWDSLLFSVPRFKSLYRLGWFYPQCKCQLDKNEKEPTTLSLKKKTPSICHTDIKKER